MSFRLDLGVKWSLRSPPKTEKALMEKSMRAFFNPALVSYNLCKFLTKGSFDLKFSC